ncbi:MAG: type II secretion system protein GspJ [Burkholderiales bacterium]
MSRPDASRGFTLVELLAALLILSLLGLMSYRGLGTVLDTRAHVQQEAGKWRSLSTFFDRFGRDAALAAPRPARGVSGTAVPWRGMPPGTTGPQIEFTRFSSGQQLDLPRRLAYTLNAEGQIELWLWPAPDALNLDPPARHVMLSGVARFDVQYLGNGPEWTTAWPAGGGAELPKAVRLRLVLASGEEIVRVFALAS